MSDYSLPKYDKRDYLGDKGIRLTENIVTEGLGWMFRDIRKNDLGIDAQFEVVNEAQEGTGRLVAMQIKCGKSYLNETNNEGFIFRGEAKHLRYWLEHSLPVIVVVCDPDIDICYWQEVSTLNTSLLDKGWKMTIPYSNVLSKKSKDELLRIAGRPQHSDIAELLLHQFLYEKYFRQIEICSIFELPRDYHYYAYLAKIRGETVMIHYHYDYIGKITLDDIKTIINWKDYNDRVCGPNPLHIYLISRSKDALNLSAEVKEYLESFNDVKYFRLQYSDDLFAEKYFFWLNELNENDQPITFWPED